MSSNNEIRVSELTKKHFLDLDKTLKKQWGIYYTPSNIADFIVQESFNEMLSLFRANEFKNGYQAINILDPACGRGVFLLKILENLENRFINNIDALNIKEVNLYCVDIDRAVLHTVENEVLELCDEVQKRHGLLVKNTVIPGNFLDPGMLQGTFKFDLIIGNPPYVPWCRIPKNDRQFFEKGRYFNLRFSCRTRHLDSQPNYYLFFLIKSINLLHDGTGITSFLLPREWLYHEKALSFRNYFVEHFQKIDILEFPPTLRIFKSAGEIVGTNSLVLILSGFEKKVSSNCVINHRCIKSKGLENVKRGDGDLVFSLHGQEVKAVRYDGRHVYDKPWAFIESWKQKIRTKILKQNVISFDDTRYFSVLGGFQPPVKKAKLFEIDGKIFRELAESEREIVYPLILDASEIKPYCFSSKQERYWIVANKFHNLNEFKKTIPNLYEILSARIDHRGKFWWHFPNTRNLAIFEKRVFKLISPRTAPRPAFALDTKGRVFKGTNTMVISKKLPLLFILGVVNSKLSEFWYKTFGFDYHGNRTQKYEPAKAKKYLLPIKIPEPNQVKAVIKLTGDILLMLGHSPDFSDPEILSVKNRLDSLVFSIYNLTSRDINCILEDLDGSK
ncbi:MAG: Eco57I restriction-modification methylase domain-containing protein [Promethearchaeota archaeon]